MNDHMTIEHNVSRTQMPVLLEKIHPATNNILDDRNIKGIVAINIPIMTDTPLPPLSRRKQDQLCPAMDARAGMLVNKEDGSESKYLSPNQMGKYPFTMMSNRIMGRAQYTPQ